MPIFDFAHWNQESGETLEETGPIIPVEIRMPTALQNLHAEQGLQMPAPVSGYALIDTGAFGTAVDETVFDHLGCRQSTRLLQPLRTEQGSPISIHL